MCAFLEQFLAERWNREYLLHENYLSFSCSPACSGHLKDKDQVTVAHQALVAMNFVGGAILTKHHKSPSFNLSEFGKEVSPMPQTEHPVACQVPRALRHHAHCPSFCYTDSLCKGPCSLQSFRILVASAAKSCSIQLGSAQVIPFALPSGPVVTYLIAYAPGDTVELLL